METINVNQPINLKVVRFELDFTQLLPDSNAKKAKKRKEIKIPEPIYKRRPSVVPPPPAIKCEQQRRNVEELIEELLDELYSERREWNSTAATEYGHGSLSVASFTSSLSNCRERTDSIEINYLEDLDPSELKHQLRQWQLRLKHAGDRLARSLRVRDRLRRQQKRICAAISVLLRHITGDPSARFSVTPGGEDGLGAGEGGYGEWLHAMRLVARLPAGVPHHFRGKLWLTLSERYLKAKGVDWPAAERACFRGTAQPDDTELGAQILKDLHRTGCSLFCGTEGRENQAMLRRVLLAYARWNKDVGYCQGFNMLAAIILEVMDKSESDSLKVMIYLVEAVLPEGYFADDLRGLSADMAAFRDLLRLRLPRLAQHMDYLQKMSDGGGVEPPLPDVFTMQWFLTLYATWLPRESLLRIWDLILLDGNEVLLLTALAIWDMLQDRILSARSADEYYSCMGGGVGAVYEAGESLVARVVALGSAPELPRLRNLHRYRVAPPAPPITAPNYHPPLHSAVQTMTRKGLRLFYSEDEGDSSDDGNKMALATVIPRREERSGTGDRLSLDIGALKRQYARLRERQRQAHVILAAACARHAAVGVPTSPTSLTVNNLLLGKSAIVSSRGRRLGAPPGAIPPTRKSSSTNDKTEQRRTSETISWNEDKSRKSLSRRNSVKWKDIKREKALERGRKASIDLDEAGDGVIVSEREANEMIASLRSRSSSNTSTYSSRTGSSSDTSLCDDNDKDSDSEVDIPHDYVNETASSNVIIAKDQLLSSTIDLESPVITTNSVTRLTPENKIDLIPKISSNTDISEYIESKAGEPLRDYIGGFECVISHKENQKQSQNIDVRLTPNLKDSQTLNLEKHEVLQSTSKPSMENYKIEDTTKTRYSKSPINITDLSPIDLSPCHFGGDQITPIDYDFKINFRRPSPSTLDLLSRPPDIIDSLTMYPNFVPDIDLSDKNISDLESPPRSPGAESIVVSEDEPPIPLKIDKYFEHSPDFFGARITVVDPQNSEITSRRPSKRLSRTPKKPDSLTLSCNYNEKLNVSDEVERASSLPQNLSFSKDTDEKRTLLDPEKIAKDDFENIMQVEKHKDHVEQSDVFSPKEYILQSGRKNSERALQIIQENSKILSRILTKQSHIDVNEKETSKQSNKEYKSRFSYIPEGIKDNNTLIDSPALKESTSDSLLGCKKATTCVKTDLTRSRPVSMIDPFSPGSFSCYDKKENVLSKSMNATSIENLVNKPDLYGWENKGFLAKCDNKTVNYNLSKHQQIKSPDLLGHEKTIFTKRVITPDWARHSFSGDSKPSSITLPSSEYKDTPTHERRLKSEEYPLTNKYNDFVISKASDICSRTVGQGPKVCENLLKTDNSQASDFTHVVTSSISFTYEPSIEDDSPTGAKSNSSDTLCQIASLDQVSTPISPKLFPRDTPTLPKGYIDNSEKLKVESDDTCSAITSLIETDTLSSLSYPRSPSTGSYHPFPTRPSMRMPKELGVRLGMYPKDSISSPPK